MDYMVYSAGESMLRNFSLSLASTNDFPLLDSIRSNAIGFGVRTMLCGTKKQENRYKTLLKNVTSESALNTLLSDAADIAAQSIDCPDGSCNWDAFIAALEAELALPPYAATFASQDIDLVKWIQASRSDIEPELAKSNRRETNKMSDVIGDFTGYATELSVLQNAFAEPKPSLELAVATALNFPTNETDFSYVSRMGVWVTGLLPLQEKWGLEAGATARYFWYNDDFNKAFLPNGEGFSKSFDVGAKLNWTRPRFMLDAEFVHRWSQVIFQKNVDPETGEFDFSGRNEEENQLLLTFKYQITNNLLLSYTWGEQLRLQSTIDQNLVSLLTITQSFGGPKLTENGLLSR